MALSLSLGDLQAQEAALLQQKTDLAGKIRDSSDPEKVQQMKDQYVLLTRAMVALTRIQRAAVEQPAAETADR